MPSGRNLLWMRPSESKSSMSNDLMRNFSLRNVFLLCNHRPRYSILWRFPFRAYFRHQVFSPVKIIFRKHGFRSIMSFKSPQASNQSCICSGDRVNQKFIHFSYVVWYYNYRLTISLGDFCYIPSFSEAFKVKSSSLQTVTSILWIFFADFSKFETE